MMTREIRELTITENEFEKYCKEFKAYELQLGDLVHLDHPHWSGFYIVADHYINILVLKKLLVDEKGNPIIDKALAKKLRSS